MPAPRAQVAAAVRAVRPEGGRIVVQARASAEPRPGEALIRPTRLGIASPDLAVLAGRVKFAGTLGHEFVGVVERVNPARDAQREWEGRRVVGASPAPCLACGLCRAGLAQHCQQRTVLGLRGRDGCFADRFTLPVANLVEVPRRVDDDHAIFAYALGAALHAVQMIRIEGKPYVTVLGDGPVGLLAAQAAARLNASVRLLGRHAPKYQLCERWGIKHRHEGEAGRRNDQDVVVDCTGSASGLALALGLVRPRGTVILRSAPAPLPASCLPGDAPGPDLSAAVANEVEIRGASGCALAEAMVVIARCGVEVLSLITRRFRLADAQAAFDAARDDHAIKVVLEP